MSELPPRERIVETAMRLFNEHGAHAVGIDRIIAESGVAKRTFYNHFPSKATLLAEFFRRRDEGWFARIGERTAAPGLSATDRVLAVFDALGEWYGRPDFFGCSFIRGLSEFGEDCDSPELAACVREHFARIEAMLTELVRPVRPKDYAKVVPQLMVLVAGGTVVAHASRDPGVAERNKALAAMILRA